MIARLGVPRRLPVFSESDVMHNAYAANLLTLSAIYAITCISPGPDFVNVTCHALNTRKSGMFAAAGVALGCCVWSTAAVFGLGLLMSGLVPLNHIMRIGGALYLAYLGSKRLLGALRPKPMAIEIRCVANGGWASLRRGFITDITNPTLVVFFGSLFATVLPADAPLWVRCAAICIITLIAGSWHLALAILFSARQARNIYQRIRRPTDAVLGAILIGLGLRLADS